MTETDLGFFDDQGSCLHHRRYACHACMVIRDARYAEQSRRVRLARVERRVLTLASMNPLGTSFPALLGQSDVLRAYVRGDGVAVVRAVAYDRRVLHDEGRGVVCSQLAIDDRVLFEGPGAVSIPTAMNVMVGRRLQHVEVAMVLTNSLASAAYVPPLAWAIDWEPAS